MADSVSILSVDAEPSFRKSVIAYLEDNGFTMYEASTKEEAISVFRHQKPDLIISGLNTPNERFELLSTIRKESPETPVVVAAYKEDSNEVIEALREGAWDFIFKPVNNMTVLEHIVCRALERGRLVTENKRYRSELEMKNQQLSQNLMQLKEDHKAGRSLQRQLLPKQNMQINNFTLAHMVIPSLYLSGDFVDYFQINENKIAFYIADVSGHGASSAFVTVLIKSLVDQLLASFHLGHDETILSPEKLLKRISDDLLHAKIGKYLTIIYGVIDFEDDNLTYGIGGHYPNPVLFDGNKSNFLPGNGFAVGIFKNASFTSHVIKLPKEFCMMMLSDGVFEIMAGKDLNDKEQRLLEMVNGVHVSIPTMLSRIKKDSSLSQPDDVTILMINRILP